MKATTRRWVTGLAGVSAFLAAFFLLMPWGCAEVGGVPSWERCVSAMGTPAFSLEDWGLDSTLNILLPVGAGLLVGVIVGAVLHRDGP